MIGSAKKVDRAVAVATIAWILFQYVRHAPPSGRLPASVATIALLVLPPLFYLLGSIGIFLAERWVFALMLPFLSLMSLGTITMVIFTKHYDSSGIIFIVVNLALLLYCLVRLVWPRHAESAT